MNWDVLDEDFEKVKFDDSFTVLVMYDISDDKRRRKMVKLLNAFGSRVQQSVFECKLNRKQTDKLIKMVDKFYCSEDLIKIYRLNKNVQTNIYGLVTNEESEDYCFL